VVSFQHDTLIPPEESKALYAYATGEGPEHGWATIEVPHLAMRRIELSS
jgi:hypothetical protein